MKNSSTTSDDARTDVSDEDTTKHDDNYTHLGYMPVFEESEDPPTLF